MSMLDQLLMKWIVKEGKDMFNLQAKPLIFPEASVRIWTWR